MNENLMNKEKLVSITTTVYDGMDLDNLHWIYVKKRRHIVRERKKNLQNEEVMNE